MGMLLTVLAGFALALVASWLDRITGRATGWLLAVLPAGITAFFAVQIPHVAAGGVLEVRYAWLEDLHVVLAFRLDGLALFFALLVAGIGVFIFIYSAGYLGTHVHAGRFYAYLLLFMASMLGLVLADNLLTLYLFFELTSLASYLLIAFEHEEEAARRAAWQALLVTNAGGLALLAGMLLMAQVAGTSTISEMMTAGEVVQASGLYLPVLLLMAAAAFTKSAQFPFYFWLPNAMEAPTPVSAYLHSATMVKAGIYVLARFSPVLGGTDAWVLLLTAIGGFTMLAAAWLVLAYTDLKRILAYSTVVVLGMLTMLLGLGSAAAVQACLVFLAVHALYKAALFMVVGAVHHESGARDVMRLGGLRRRMPVVFGAALLAACSMAGLPPLLGFVGKELVYDAALHADLAPTFITAITVLASVGLVAAAGIVALRPFLGTPTRLAGRAQRAPVSLWLGPVLLGALALLLGLFPSFVGAPLVAPAMATVLGEATEVHLGLWHGWTPELGLSALTVAAGAAVFARWDALRKGRVLRGMASVFGEGLDRGYDHVIHGMLRMARGQVRVLQNGSLRFYMSVVFAFLAAVSACALVRAGLPGWPDDSMGLLLYEALLGVLILMAALGAVLVRSPLGALLSVSVVGFSLALLYLLNSAPDLALAQLIVETLTVILVVLVLVDLREQVPTGSQAGHLRDAALAVGVGAVMTGLMLAVLQVPFDDEVARYYAQQSYQEAHGRNIVNVILVDFRALDTLGEITVLAVAGLSIFAFVRLSKRVHEEKHTDTAEEEAMEEEMP